MNDVTQLLAAVQHGDKAASEQLLPLVYEELRQLAAARLRQESPGQTLQATALVHEAYVRLVNSQHTPSWEGRGHFFAAAAEAMRRILIDIARRKNSGKHGGAWRRVPLGELGTATVSPEADNDQLLAIDDALTAFEAIDPEKARLVKLRFYTGMTIDDAAEVLGISRATANRHWTFAKAWLYGRLCDEE